MKPSVRAWAFESKYLRDFAVVEERHNGLRLFPATEQLPLLAPAIEQEFRAGLTTRLAATDGRADPWRKLQLREAAMAFSNVVNAARPDHLHIRQYYPPDLVTQIAIVQQITESTPGGNRHWFRQYRGTDFLPDIYLSGKRVVFSGHAIARYAQRTLSEYAHPTNSLIGEFWHNIIAVLQLDGHSPAFVLTTTDQSVAILPFEETATEFFILTTLSPHQTRTLTAPEPLRRVHLHYGPAYQLPARTIFSYENHVARILDFWRARPHAIPPPKPLNVGSWMRVVHRSQEILREQGHSEASQIAFYDNVHGPCIITGQPRQSPAPPTA